MSPHTTTSSTIPTTTFFFSLLVSSANLSLHPYSSPNPNLVTAFSSTPGSDLIRATLFPGDGIGPEIAESVKQVFREAEVPIEWEEHYVRCQLNRSLLILFWYTHLPPPPPIEVLVYSSTIITIIPLFF